MDKKIIALFGNHDNLDSAMRLLHDHGYNRADISVVTSNDIANYETPENTRDGMTTGGVLGAATGLILGMGIFSIPGLGFLAAAGPIAAFLTGGAAGGIIGSLADFGIPHDDLDGYLSQIKDGKILFSIDVPVHTSNEVCDLLERAGAEDVNIHI